MEWKETVRGTTKDQDIPILVTKRWVCAEEAEKRISQLEALLTRAYDWMQPMPCSASCETFHFDGTIKTWGKCDCGRESICDDIDASGFIGGARTVQIKGEG